MLLCGPHPAGAREGLALIAYHTSGARAYALGCTIAGAARVLEWCCSRLGAFASIEELVAQAATAPQDESVVFVPAFAGLPAPNDGSSARAAILGLHMAADRSSIARAALESLAFQVADALALMREVSGVAVARLRVDGGLAHSDLLIQMQSDLLGVPVERPSQGELASLGIACLAARGAGLTVDEDFLERGRGEVRVFTPQLDEAGRRRRMALWRAGVERAAGWAKG
jgi:glycerol kinase